MSQSLNGIENLQQLVRFNKKILIDYIQILRPEVISWNDDGRISSKHHRLNLIKDCFWNQMILYLRGFNVQRNLEWLISTFQIELILGGAGYFTWIKHSDVDVFIYNDFGFDIIYPGKSRLNHFHTMVMRIIRERQKSRFANEFHIQADDPIYNDWDQLIKLLSIRQNTYQTNYFKQLRQRTDFAMLPPINSTVLTEYLNSHDGKALQNDRFLFPIICSLKI